MLATLALTSLLAVEYGHFKQPRAHPSHVKHSGNLCATLLAMSTTVYMQPQTQLTKVKADIDGNSKVDSNL